MVSLWPVASNFGPSSCQTSVRAGVVRIFSSAAAANAPASSLRTWTQPIPSVVRIASTNGFRLSPTTP